MFQPERTIHELKELRALTGDENGVQRLAWTETWLKAREWFTNKLTDLPVECHYDAAGNHWITLAGKSEKALIIGSHLDSVPNGGWLDGALGVLAGLEILRSWADKGKPPITLKLVDWADEEGARFGRSLFGSAAFSGHLDLNAEKARIDRDGIPLPEALQRCGINLNDALQATKEQANAAAYLELHIEQGPVLESQNAPLAVVLGTKGVERHQVTFTGQEAHSGSTPMNARKDALAAAAKLALELYPIAQKHPHAVSTMGNLKTFPGIPTAVVGRAQATIDQRDLDPEILGKLLKDAQEASHRFAKEHGCTAEWSEIYRISPVAFHPELIELCAQAVSEESGQAPRLPSGPLHDAAEVALAGIPTVMMFVQSLGGISHNKVEDTKEEHLVQAIKAMARLADLTANWIQTH